MKLNGWQKMLDIMALRVIMLRKVSDTLKKHGTGITLV